MITVTHTSPEKINSINEIGLFDDCLFFSHDEYVMTESSTIYTYNLDLSESDIVDESELFDADIIEHIASVLEVSEEEAEGFLDGSEIVQDSELSWWIQAQQGKCAKKMGFKACRSNDEQGEIFIVPMFGRESDLKLVKQAAR